jgi:hypothetical protein
VLIPSLQKNKSVFDHERLERGQFVTLKALGARKGDRLQPELGDTIALLDVNMRRFSALVAVEEKPKTADYKHRRHAAILYAERVPRTGAMTRSGRLLASRFNRYPTAAVRTAPKPLLGAAADRLLNFRGKQQSPP